MTRRECLDKAAECVLQDRASQYGGPEDNFGRIAKLWSTYTGTVLDGIDVAMMMSLLKVARIRNNKDYSDGYIDLAGYAACGAELAGAEKAREDATRKWGDEYRRLRAKAEGDAKAEGCEELVEKDAPLCGERCEEFIPGLGTCESCRHAREQDAPQTPAELYDRIVANNPATFKARTPTGEELAEMAEEDAHV